MFRIKRLIVLIIFSSSLFTGCSEPLPPVSEKTALAVCGSFCVAGMYCADLKGDAFACNVLERDDYGRVLYEYITKSVITGKQETAWVICQKIDDSFVYFYEDVCYLFGTPSEEALRQLKVQNQWGEEFHFRGMTKRPLKVTFDLFIVMESPFETKQVKSECCKLLSLSASQVKELCIIDATYKSALYWLEFEDSGKRSTGYLLLTPDGCAFLGADSHSSPETLKDFKEKNNWM